jgi:hypothetical protein
LREFWQICHTGFTLATFVYTRLCVTLTLDAISFTSFV